MKYVFILSLLLLLPGCFHNSHPEDTPWCTSPLHLPVGRLFPTGTLEQKKTDKIKRHYLPHIRDDENIGLALTRLPGGRVMITDLVLAGPADKAGLRPGMEVQKGDKSLSAIMAGAIANGHLTVLEKGIPRKIELAPEKDFKGWSTTWFPLLISIEGDRSHCHFSCLLDIIDFTYRRIDTGPGELADSYNLELFWGLLTF